MATSAKHAARLSADAEYLTAAKDYLAAPASDPVYQRINSSLLVPIEGMPRLEKPDTSKLRLLNLRVQPPFGLLPDESGSGRHSLACHVPDHTRRVRHF